MADKKISTTLEQDKKCKSCVRFRSDADDEVTTAVYIQNAGMEKLGNPTKIKVTVEPAK